MRATLILVLLLCIVCALQGAAAETADTFVCKEMWASFTLPTSCTAEFFPNLGTNRPMISVTNENGDEVAGIVWFRDIKFWRDPLDFVLDWVLEGNETDKVLEPDPALVKKLNPLRKVEIWGSANGTPVKKAEFWQISTGIGLATLLVTSTPTEDGKEQITYGAYTKRRGSILWIYASDQEVVQKILASIKGVTL